MTRKIFITLLLIISAYGSLSAEIKRIGTPFIRNFSKQDYRAGTHNWAIAQDAKGFMYFANDEGLLVFDGVQWQLFKMPNLSMVRSIWIDNTGDIYVGAYNDIGRMVHSDNGQMTFRSLKDLIPEEYRNFDDVWNVLPYKNSIIFQSYYTAYVYMEGSPVSVLTAPARFQGAYGVRDRLIFNDEREGLVEYDGEKLVPLSGCSEIKGQDVSSVMPYKADNEILICTRGKGLYIHDGTSLRQWRIPASEQFKTDQIFSATMLPDNHYALGTILNGVLIIDDEGQIVQDVNRKKGLQNNTILSLFSDRAGNLWLGLDNGIDYLTINSPVTFIQNPDGFGAGYTSAVYEGRLYVGTNQGLYVKEWENGISANDFSMIPGTNGQVWYLGEHKGVLICGHDKGTFIVKGEEARLVNSILGGWKYLEPERFPGYMIGGTYNGIILFRWDQGSWKYLREIKGFSESFRVFEEDDNGDIWMSHGFKGVYKVRLDSELDSVVSSRYYTESDGLPSNYNLNVFRIRDKIIITSEKGIYEYLPSDERFAYSVYFNKLLSPLVSISYLREDNVGNIWYVADNKTGVFRMQEDFTFQNVTFPFTLLSGRFIHGFESIYPYSPEHVLFGIENGFAHYSPHGYFKNYFEFSAYITRVVSQNTDTVFYFGKSPGVDSRSRFYNFPYKNNHLIFTYTSPVYDNPGNIEYSYRLSGLDADWSPWNSSYVKEYSNLPDGRFEFQVKARNQLGKESVVDSTMFAILPPWYKSIVAYVGYVVLTISAILVLIWTVNKRIELSGKRERLNNLRVYRAKEQEFLRQALEAEKEIIRIKNEKLNAEMILRDKELANQAMNLLRKNEFLLKIKDELQSLKQACNDKTVEDKILYIMSRLNREVDSNKQREVFEVAFDEVHEDFINKLKTRYPSLTPTELRLCAFLKMNISTKEIAPLMNISVRGVEICRYRIRKKIGITRDTNLTGMLLNI